MKITIAKELTYEEAKEIFGKEFTDEYEAFTNCPSCYSKVGDFAITMSGLVLLQTED